MEKDEFEKGLKLKGSNSRSGNESVSAQFVEIIINNLSN